MVGVRALPPAAAPAGMTNIWYALFGTAASHTRFRLALSQYLGAQQTYLADSGRSALYLLLDTLCGEVETQGRNEVILPAYTCPALTKVILDVGLRPRWVDLDSHSMQMITDEVARHAGPSTLAILVVHPFGLPHPVHELYEIARTTGALLIEDCAQSLGAMQSGQRVGTFGDAGLFSFGPGKPLSTGGGGLLVTNQSKLATWLDARWSHVAQPGPLRSFAALLRLGIFETLFHPVAWAIATRAGIQRFGESEAGWHYRLQELSNNQAEVGLRLLPNLDQMNRQRRRIAEQLGVATHGSQQLWTPLPNLVSHAISASHSWAPVYLRYPLLAQDGDRRDALYQELYQAGIGAGKMYRKTMPHYFPLVKDGPFPGAAQIVETLITLPTHRYVGEQDLATMQRILARWA